MPMPRYDLMKETPRQSIVVLLASVFLFFTTFGFAFDMIDMGQEPALRLWLVVIFSGLFAVGYAATSILLRRRWWKGVLLLFAMQYVVMSLVGRWIPDLPQPAIMTVAALGRLRARMALDSIATIIAVSVGYMGFFWVVLRETRRYAMTRTEHASLENEMAAARQVQQVILPNPHQRFPGLAVESVYRPARELGGDFFQFVQVADGGLLFVIGDVAGKGLPAAMLVSLLVGSIRATAEQTHHPARLLGRMHEQIMGRTADGFATALAALIRKDGGVTFANAGHLSPYLDGREFVLPGGLPLGIAGGGEYETRTAVLREGSRLTFVSDGVVEAQNGHRELFGFERTEGMARERAATIAEAAVEFGQEDDITVVTIERRAQ